MDVPGAFYFDFAVSDANSHWEDNSSVMSSRFVEEMENPDRLTTELYWRTDFEPSISSCSYIFCHPQTDIVSPHWEQEWHLIIPNPSLCPLFLVLCHFDFAFWICLWLSASPIFFFLVQWFLPCLSPVRFWPGETYSMLLSGLPVRDIWTLMTGKPMLLVLRVRTSFIFCHRQNIFIFPRFSMESRKWNPSNKSLHFVLPHEELFGLLALKRQELIFFFF